MLQGMAELADDRRRNRVPHQRKRRRPDEGHGQARRVQNLDASGRRSRRPIELEALLGAPREIAATRGIPTPALDRLYGVTRLMSESLA